MAIKKSEAKKVQEDVELNTSEIEADASEEEIENVEDIEIEEIDEWNNDSNDKTAAANSLKANSEPVGPANKTAAISKIVNALSKMDVDTINGYAKVVPTVLKANDGAGNNAAKNKATIDAKKGGNKDFTDIPEEKEFELDEEVKTVVYEEISNLFEGEDLKPEFKEKISVIIESITNLNTSKRVVELEEEYENALLEEVSNIHDSLVEHLDTFLDTVVDRWLDNNEVAIVSTLKSDLTEQFVDGLRELFETNYVTIPEDRVDMVEELVGQVENLKELINASLEEKVELEKVIETKENEIEESKVNLKIAELSEGLSDSDKERFLSLTENVEYENLEDFTKKAAIIKESVYKNETTKKDTTVLFEETEILEDEKVDTKLTGSIAQYVKALDNFK